MARLTPEKTATRSLAITGRADAKTDATSWASRTPTRNRSDRSLVKDRRRVHRCALDASRLTRRRALRPGSSTGASLRTRTNLEVRDSPKTQTTLRRQDHPRRPLPRRLIWKTSGKQRFVTFRWAMSRIFLRHLELNAWMASTKMLKDLTCNVS